MCLPLSIRQGGNVYASGSGINIQKVSLQKCRRKNVNILVFKAALTSPLSIGNDVLYCQLPVIQLVMQCYKCFLTCRVGWIRGCEFQCDFRILQGKCFSDRTSSLCIVTSEIKGHMHPDCTAGIYWQSFGKESKRRCHIL